MKFIGQFIQDFIARFRNDVYLEDVSTGTIASGGNLGLDSNNKIVKADTNAGELSITNASDNRVVTSTGGTGLNAESTLTYVSETLTISSTTSSRPTVSLLNTNADENAPTFNFMKVGASAADNDTLGTILYTSTNDAAEGISYADFVTTIADASDGDESGKIAIRVLADGTLRNFIDGTGVKLDVDGVTHDVVNLNLGYGTESQTVIAGDFSAKGGLLSYANNDLTLDSSTSARPNLFLSNSNTDAEAPTVTFQKVQTGADNDDIGIIRFKADDDGNNVTTFAEILGEIETAANGSEGGNLILKVASHDGEMQEGIKISDGDVEDEIDVTIGSGTSSTTTISGLINITSSANILGNSYLVFGDDDNSHTTRVRSSTTSTNRTILFPDATGTVALTSDVPDELVSNNQAFTWKYVKVVVDQSACNSMHSTPVQLIAAQGSDTIIVLGPGYLFVDKNTAIAQAESAADLNVHFADLDPGVFGQTSLYHIRRFMNADNADRIYKLEGNEREVGQSLIEGTNKDIEASFDSAVTNNSITSVTFHLSYYVIDLS